MTTKTVFVIGAGASNEVGIPTGSELKGIISKLLDIRFDGYQQKSGDYQIVNALKKYVTTTEKKGDINPFLKEAKHIRDALPQALSVDNFIDTQRGNDALALCGKLSIVKAILSSENSCLLYFKDDHVNSTLKFNLLEKTWFIPFFQLITENCTKDDLLDRFKSISLIIFNYDRCVEHFLFNALINYYRIKDEESAKLVSQINIYHPYGKVGHLPWQERNRSTKFGDDIGIERLLELSMNIKTFTEGTDPNSSDILSIRKDIGTTERLVFIGFAFHKLNMELISPSKFNRTDFSNFNCFATTLGISDSDKNIIKRQIASLYKRNVNKININMISNNCCSLFHEFWRSLSF